MLACPDWMKCSCTQAAGKHGRQGCFGKGNHDAMYCYNDRHVISHDPAKMKWTPHLADETRRKNGPFPPVGTDYPSALLLTCNSSVAVVTAPAKYDSTVYTRTNDRMGGQCDTIPWSRRCRIWCNGVLCLEYNSNQARTGSRVPSLVVHCLVHPPTTGVAEPSLNDSMSE